MKKKTGLYFVMAVILGITSCASMPATWKEAGKIIPLPADVKIIPPSSDLPPELAAFSKKWVGEWDGWRTTILVVQEITEKEVKVVFGIAADPAWRLEPFCGPMVGKVFLNPPRIEFSKGTTYFLAFERRDSTFIGYYRYYRGSAIVNSSAILKPVVE